MLIALALMLAHPDHAAHATQASSTPTGDITAAAYANERRMVAQVMTTGKPTAEQRQTIALAQVRIEAALRRAAAARERKDKRAEALANRAAIKELFVLRNLVIVIPHGHGNHY